MKILVDNKGLIMFYVCVILLMGFWVNKVDKDNDRIMNQKNAYVLNAR